MNCAYMIWQLMAAARLLTTSITIFWSVSGLAGNQPSGSMRDIYILRSAGKTAVVMPSEKKMPDDAVYMRMPDHKSEQEADVYSHEGGQIRRFVGQTGGRLTKERLADDQNSSSKSFKVESTQGSHLDVSAHGPTKGKSSGLVFSAAKIKGAVRLPRVKFARVGIPTELRDEAPSLDFTDKTLKDSGY